MNEKTVQCDEAFGSEKFSQCRIRGTTIDISTYFIELPAIDI